MKPEMVEVHIGRMRLKVPVVVDEATTLRVAEQVNARLEEIEHKSTRVDSLHSALLAAMSIACELETTRLKADDDHEQSATDQAGEQREYFQALHRIADAIRQEPPLET